MPMHHDAQHVQTRDLFTEAVDIPSPSQLSDVAVEKDTQHFLVLRDTDADIQFQFERPAPETTPRLLTILAVDGNVPEDVVLPASITHYLLANRYQLGAANSITTVDSPMIRLHELVADA